MFVYQRVNLLQHHKPNMFVNSTNLAITVFGAPKRWSIFWTGWVGSPRDLDRFYFSERETRLGTNCKAQECSISCFVRRDSWAILGVVRCHMSKFHCPCSLTVAKQQAWSVQALCQGLMANIGWLHSPSQCQQIPPSFLCDKWSRSWWGYQGHAKSREKLLQHWYFARAPQTTCTTTVVLGWPPVKSLKLTRPRWNLMAFCGILHRRATSTNGVTVKVTDLQQAVLEVLAGSNAPLDPNRLVQGSSKLQPNVNVLRKKNGPLPVSRRSPSVSKRSSRQLGHPPIPLIWGKGNHRGP